MSPQEAHSLVGHSPAQKEDIVERARWSAASTEAHEDFAPYGTMIDALADEIERLRAVIDRIRCACAGTDPVWVKQIVEDAIRETKP